MIKRTETLEVSSDRFASTLAMVKDVADFTEVECKVDAETVVRSETKFERWRFITRHVSAAHIELKGKEEAVEGVLKVIRASSLIEKPHHRNALLEESPAA